jgi:hypothetical protein
MGQKDRELDNNIGSNLLTSSASFLDGLKESGLLLLRSEQA